MKAVARAKLEAELFTLNKAALLNALALAGVTRVVVSFDGCGDFSARSRTSHRIRR